MNQGSLNHRSYFLFSPLPVPRGRVRVGVAFQCLFIAWVTTAAQAGTVKTDGTIGPPGQNIPLVNNVFTIGANLGTQKGGNLFHSFNTFNLDQGETANFTGPSNITNVIARVTGGQPSAIDGTLECTIPGANFYFINPAGIVFGQGAALNVTGSVALSTADYLKLKDGTKFSSASSAPNPTLVSAPPAAFGFMNAPKYGIAVSNASLSTGSGAVRFIG